VDTKADLFESGVEVFDDFLGENVGIGETIEFFAGFLASRSVAD